MKNMLHKSDSSYVGAINELFEPEIHIGKYSQIANGVTFIGGGEHPSGLDQNIVANYPFAEKWNVENYPKTGSRGNIIICNDVWVGENATIMSGVIIGDGAIIGAGAVVRHSIFAYDVAVGNPARVVRPRFDQARKMSLQKIKWWEWPEEKIREALPYMKNIDTFIERYG